MEKNILNIYCPDCGAPAQFEIIHQVYACQYCGGKVTIKDAKTEKGKILKKYSGKGRENYALETTTCPGCGATVVFAENEALTNCEFCGSSLVRKRYTGKAELPQYIIPFGVTPEEAKGRLAEWCDQNKRRPEAEHLRSKMSDLKGYYLPYEMVRGPVHCFVSKRDEGARFEANGYLKDEFINCSEQLDNLVLDAMEPFDLENLQKFDFAYVAGHRVKITDIGEKAVTQRLHDEAEANYRIRFEKIWGTKSISTETTVEEVIRFPVLLPVYYITDGETKAAVNGQTGKVSVCAEKESSYLSVPWWFRGLLVLLLALGVTYGALAASGYTVTDCLYFTGVLGIFYFFILFCLLQASDSRFGIFHYRQIYNSGEQTYHREQGKLVVNENVLQRRIEEPVFRQKLDGKVRTVTYSFYSVQRMVLMIVISLLIVFLPVILALFVNGFDFARLDLGGSCAWFCITVPIVPIGFIRFAIMWLYDEPRIYVFTKDGKRERYRKKIDKKKVKEGLKFGLRLLFIPPGCLAVWFAILSMIVMVYLTAFGV